MADSGKDDDRGVDVGGLERFRELDGLFRWHGAVSGAVQDQHGWIVGGDMGDGAGPLCGFTKLRQRSAHQPAGWRAGAILLRAQRGETCRRSHCTDRRDAWEHGVADSVGRRGDGRCRLAGEAHQGREMAASATAGNSHAIAVDPPDVGVPLDLRNGSPAVVELRGKHRSITEPVADARHRVALACQPDQWAIRLGAVAPRVAMDPDDERHATGIASGRQVQIKPLPSMGGLARLWLAVGLVTVCRDASGIWRRRHRRGHSWRGQCGVGRHGRCRALFRRCHWKELRGRQRIAERWTNRHRLARHLVERRPSPGAATLGSTGAAATLRHFHARGGIGCRPGILPPGDGHMRRQEHLHRACFRSGDRVDQQWHDQQGSWQQSPRAGCGGGEGRKNRHSQSIPSDAIPDAPDHRPTRPRARRACSAAGPGVEREGDD